MNPYSVISGSKVQDVTTFGTALRAVPISYRSYFALLIFTASALNLRADEFRNLGFDNPLQTTSGFFSDLVPGWTLARSYPSLGLSTNNNPVFFNNPFLESGQLSLNGAAGQYSLAMEDPYSLQKPEAGRFILQQRGDIPTEARSITFEAIFGNFELRINGAIIPTVPFIGPSNLKWGDISAFAGQNVELQIWTDGFSFIPPPGSNVSPIHRLDNIAFVSTPVPEPSTWALFGVGGAALFLRRRFVRR